MLRGAWFAALVLALSACGDRNVQDFPDPSSTGRAVHPTVSLANSNFEIDVDANLLADDAPPSLDWASVAEDRQPDTPSGASDDSFGQGSKEDTASPVVVDGSIPPNKSDLLNFGVYLEKNGDYRFLHVFWHRVQEPTGTTNMDFEFNQSSVLSENGVTPVRTSGDILIQYDLAQGGTTPELFVSRWVDGTEGATAADCEASNKLPCWNHKVNLSSAGDATGAINTSPIAAADSDGLGDVSPRTFGEASIDFNALVGGSTACVAFGSAYLKSRSSDSFTSALKDFIAPKAVNISNCGSIKVVKLDDSSPPAALSGASFDLVKDAAPTGGGAPGAEDTEVVASCTTNASGECLFSNVFQGEYWVVETAAPAGYDMAAPQHATVGADQTVTLNFVDPRQRGAIKITTVRKHAAAGSTPVPHAGVNFTVNGVTKATDANGVVCFDNLLFGTYMASESVPANYKGEADKSVVVDNKASCSDSPYVGESVNFTNTPLSTIAVSFTSQVPGGTAAKISCAGLTDTGPDATPDAFDDTLETFVDLMPGTYTCTVVVDP